MTRPLLLALCLVSLACGGDTGGSTDTDAATSEATSETEDTHATEETHAHETSDETAGTDVSTSHTHETDTHETETETETDSHGSTTEPLDPTTPEGYCACMLENCHDLYHSTWGEDHVESETNCLAAANAVPSAGMEVMAGDYIECRGHFCAEAVHDEALCESAIGMGVCQ